MKPTRKSLENKIIKLEAQVARIRDAFPDPVMVGRLTFEQFYSLLFEEEREQVSDLLEWTKDNELASEQEALWENIVLVAHERHDNGLKVVTRQRTIEEHYAEMKARQQAGEKIFYGDLAHYEENLEPISKDGDDEK